MKDLENRFFTLKRDIPVWAKFIAFNLKEKIIYSSYETQYMETIVYGQTIKTIKKEKNFVICECVDKSNEYMNIGDIFAVDYSELSRFFEDITGSVMLEKENNILWPVIVNKYKHLVTIHNKMGTTDSYVEWKKENSIFKNKKVNGFYSDQENL